MSVIVTTPQAFPAQLKKVMKKDIPNWQGAMHKKIHIQTARGMIMGTPVGNPDLWQYPDGAPEGYVGGRARGNWQSSVGWPVAGETGTVDKAGGETLSANVSAAARIPAYSRSFISNNVPYINVLNDGLNGNQHTFQAPLQWMEGVLDKVIAQFNRDAL